MRARLLLGLAVLGALWSGQAITPLPALACSCVMPEPMATYRGDSTHMIFTGRVLAVAPTGVDVAVERWFQGPGGPTIRFSPEGFGDQGASCQEAWPTVGSRWVWVAWVPGVGAAPQTNLCIPKAQLDTPEGEAMVADVREAFGAGRAGQPPDDTADPPAPTPPAAELLPVVLGAVGLAAFTVFAGVALLARRRATPDGR